MVRPRTWWWCASTRRPTGRWRRSRSAGIRSTSRPLRLRSGCRSPTRARCCGSPRAHEARVGWSLVGGPSSACLLYCQGQLGDGLLDLGGGRGADLARADQLIDLAFELRHLVGRLLTLAAALVFVLGGFLEGVGEVAGLVQQVLCLLVDGALLAGGGDHRGQVGQRCLHLGCRWRWWSGRGGCAGCRRCGGPGLPPGGGAANIWPQH